MEGSRRQSSFGWLGWVFFFILIFGSRFAPTVANWLSQVTGLNITAGGLMGTVAVLYIASLILGPILGTVLRNAGGGDSGAPTIPTQPGRSPYPTAGGPSAPQMPAPSTPPFPQASTPRLPPMTSAKTPGAPRWEPIIDPRILVFGIIGVIVLGGFLLVALLLAGSI
jgi:hypothetical protein